MSIEEFYTLTIKKKVELIKWVLSYVAGDGSNSSAFSTSLINGCIDYLEINDAVYTYEKDKYNLDFVRMTWIGKTINHAPHYVMYDFIKRFESRKRIYRIN